MIKFNMNYNVRVRLTEEGHNILRQNYEELYSNVPEALIKYPYREKEVDGDGYSEFHLWELMKEFGEHCYMGNMNLPFHTTFLIDPDQRL